MIRKINASPDEIGSGRNVTGPLQIGDDWPGTFFRGDHSAHRAGILRRMAKEIEARGNLEGSATMGYFAKYLNELADEFSACIITPGDAA